MMTSGSIAAPPGTRRRPLITRSAFTCWLLAAPLLVALMALLTSPVHATDPEDSRWSGLFSVSGIDGTVECAVMNGTDLIVGGTFQHAGGVPVRNVARWDGSAWHAMGMDPDEGLAGTVFALAVYNGSLYAGGYFATSGGGGTPLHGIARWDGTTWQSVGGGISTGGAVFALTIHNGKLVAGGTFSEVGAPPQLEDNVAAWNGSAWSTLAGGLDKIVRALTVYNGELIAGGYFQDRLAHFNGTSWARLGDGFDSAGGIEALAVHDTKLYVGGSFSGINGGDTPATNIAAWNGVTFSTVGAGCGVAAADTVYELSVFSGKLVVGGNFLTPHPGVTQWDGAAFGPLGGGVTGSVRGLCATPFHLFLGGQFKETSTGTRNLVRWSVPPGVYSRLNTSQAPDDVVTHLGVWNNKLVVGGSFVFAGGQNARGIALFDSIVMTPLGTGLVGNLGGPPFVYASVPFGGELVIGGEFSQAGGAPVNNLARWNGAAWSALGGGFNDRVTDLEMFGGQLIAAGRFTQTYDGPTSVAHLAQWNGVQWQPLGGGVAGGAEVINAMTLFNGELVVAGSFTTAGGVPANRIARWNGAAWSALGSGVNGSVTSLAVLNTDLYVGGFFTTAGGQPNPYLAKWNGSAWSAVDGAADNPVLALTVAGSKLYAGGYFNQFGAVTAARVAEWNGTIWNRMGSGTDGDVNALAFFKDGIYAGGLFHHAGTRPSDFLARWSLGATAVGEPGPGSTRPAFALSPAWPNPFSASTSVRFTLPAAGAARLSVFDAQGRLVAPPRGAEFPAGAQRLGWDGRDADGAPARAGVYFLRVETAGGAAAQKVILQR